MTEVTVEEAFEKDASMDGKFLTFSLQKEEYAIPIHFVTEIIGIQKITLLPDMPVFIKG
ncbi:MAG: chemotaxis protein CheW, partial [Calditrichia bacterium]